MNIRPRAGEIRCVTTRTFPHLRPVSQGSFLAAGMLVPTPGAALAQPRRAALPIRLRARREKVFGAGRAVPLDRNAKCRIAAYARAWTRRHARPGQHRGPITRAFLEVLEALLWGFHNSRDGRCFPSYERIADKAQCARSTVAEALKVLEFAGVLTWQHRIARVRERCRDLFGRDGWRWRVVRTSNAYAFRDPQQRPAGLPACKSENLPGTPDQEIQSSLHPAIRCRTTKKDGIETGGWRSPGSPEAQDRAAIASAQQQLAALGHA
jgi:Helix-turn-helix domain